MVTTSSVRFFETHPSLLGSNGFHDCSWLSFFCLANLCRVICWRNLATVLSFSMGLYSLKCGFHLPGWKEKAIENQPPLTILASHIQNSDKTMEECLVLFVEVILSSPPPVLKNCVVCNLAWNQKIKWQIKHATQKWNGFVKEYHFTGGYLFRFHAIRCVPESQCPWWLPSPTSLEMTRWRSPYWINMAVHGTWWGKLMLYWTM